MIDMSCPPEFNLFGSPHLIILLIWLKFKFNLKLRYKMMMDMFLPARIQLFASSAFNQPLLVQIHQDVLSAPSFARNQRSRERKRSFGWGCSTSAASIGTLQLIHLYSRFSIPPAAAVRGALRFFGGWSWDFVQTGSPPLCMSQILPNFIYVYLEQVNPLFLVYLKNLRFNWTPPLEQIPDFNWFCFWGLP